MACAYFVELQYDKVRSRVGFAEVDCNRLQPAIPAAAAEQPPAAVSTSFATAVHDSSLHAAGLKMVAVCSRDMPEQLC